MEVFYFTKRIRLLREHKPVPSCLCTHLSWMGCLHGFPCGELFAREWKFLHASPIVQEKRFTKQTLPPWKQSSKRSQEDLYLAKYRLLVLFCPIPATSPFLSHLLFHCRSYDLQNTCLLLSINTSRSYIASNSFVEKSPACPRICYPSLVAAKIRFGTIDRPLQ